MRSVRIHWRSTMLLAMVRPATNARRLIWLLAGLLFGCSNPSGQDSSQPSRGTRSVPPPPPDAYVFYTSEDEVARRFIIAYRRGELFIQLAEVSDDGTIASRQYFRSELPEDFSELMESWLRRGQTAVRGMPGGRIDIVGPRALTRHWLYESESRGHGWDGFVDDDEVQAFLQAVRDCTVSTLYETETPPRWAEDDDRIWNDFWGTGSPP
ncbi:MAG: hypothetical protein ACKV0T_27215 [Planctomycetales bacterium]